MTVPMLCDFRHRNIRYHFPRGLSAGESYDPILLRPSLKETSGSGLAHRRDSSTIGILFIVDAPEGSNLCRSGLWLERHPRFDTCPLPRRRMNLEPPT